MHRIKEKNFLGDFHLFLFNIFFVIPFLLFFPSLGNSAYIERDLRIDFYFDTSSIIDKSVTGYRLYKQGELICENISPVGQSITCMVSMANGTFSFSLSAFFSDGSESPQSSSFDFTFDANKIPGDINGDSIINIADIIVGLQNLTSSNTAGVSVGGDVNGDGKIGLEEVIHCLKAEADS